MNKKYIEQMDQVHMPDHLRKQILRKSKSCKKPWYASDTFRYTCVGASCICLLVVGFFTLKYMNMRNTQLSFNGMSGLSGFDGDKEKAKDNDSSDSESQMEKEVQEDKRVTGGLIGSYGGADKTGSAFGSMPEIAPEKAAGKEMPIYEVKVDQEPQQLITLLETLDIPWEKNVNVFENSKYKITYDKPLSYTVIDKQAYDVTSTSDVYKNYYSYLPIENPIQSCNANGCTIYEQQNDILLNYVNKALFSVQFSMQEVSENDQFHVTFTSFDTSMLEKLQTVTLITQKEAEQKLLEGDYYSTEIDKRTIQKEDIMDIKVMYTGVSEHSATYPYVLPIYRYYVKQDLMRTEYDVVAIDQEDLVKLDKVSW